MSFLGTLLPFLSFVLSSQTVSLLALMTILAQSLLTLVGSHLVALLLLSVWHNDNILNVKLFHLGYKALGGLK